MAPTKITQVEEKICGKNLKSHFKSLSQETSNQQIRFVMIRIDFVFYHFKSIPLKASGEGFRNQSKGEKVSSFW